VLPAETAQNLARRILQLEREPDLRGLGATLRG
jgi:bacterioferritin (cytochrome b1)